MRHDFPDKNAVNQAWTHDLHRLADLADLLDEIENDKAIKARWSTVKDWSEKKRYEPKITETDARSLIRAIDDPTNGILQWLQDRW